MNPTDQARKEARKKELKKNKRQRQLVRTAVLKGKDPLQLINEMEKIDQMEFNVLQPSPLNEKVLKEKRKKLRDTLDRVMKMYIKDDPDRWEELKRAEHDYEKRRSTLLAHYDSVKHAQQVIVDDIPLPQLGTDSLANFAGGIPSQIPLPPMMTSLPEIGLPPPPPATGILRKRSVYSPPHPTRSKSPPGVPPGPPPDFSDDEIIDASAQDEPNLNKDTKKIKMRRKIRFAGNNDESDSEDADESDEERNENEDDSNRLRPTSLQQKMLAMAGQDIDSFMKEIEEVHKSRSSGNENSDQLDSQDPFLFPPTGLLPPGLPPAPPLVVPPPLIGGMIRLPPGPPPGRPPTMPPGPPPGLPPSRLMNIRLPPGPPPGMPPRMIRFPTGIPLPPMAGPPPLFPMNSVGSASTATPNVLSAAPQLINRSSESTATSKSGTTIEAKAQIRNLSADVTRFVPTALRVKKDDIKSNAKTKTTEKSNVSSVLQSTEAKFEKAIPSQNAGKNTQQTKDDAYMQFMKEMQGLL